MFIHTVYFWMTKDAPASAQDALIKGCLELLGKIPTVKQIWAGKPAMTPRDVVDNSYQVGLTVVLGDSEGHDVYQTHPLHLEFIKQHKAYWQRVQVYDYKPQV